MVSDIDWFGSITEQERVLILLWSGYGLWPNVSVTPRVPHEVLILLWSGYGLWRPGSRADRGVLGWVLILLWSGYGLWPFEQLITEAKELKVLILLWSGYGLWPLQEVFGRLFWPRLNPTLIWIWSLTVIKVKERVFGLNSLNPTLIWIWSLTQVLPTKRKTLSRS